METLVANNQNVKCGKCTVDEGRELSQQLGGRRFKSCPRHQDKAKGSNDASLHFFGPKTQILRGAATSGAAEETQRLLQLNRFPPRTSYDSLPA